jgi:O-antigen/teichoic acid export membrane protein
MGDQAVVSLGNFLLTVILARSLSKVEYGTYVVLYGALLTANSLHAALVTYPISVLGAHRSPRELRLLSSNSLIITSLLGVPVSGVLILAAWIITRRTDLLLFVIAAMLCWQFQETLRRSLMSHLRHRRALLGDSATYAGEVIIVYWIVHTSTHVTARAGFGAILVASLAGAIIHAAGLGLGWPRFTESLRLAREYFTLGRFPMLSSLGYAGTLLLVPWVLAFKGLAEVASYQAMMNVVQVVNPVMFSVGNLVIPAVAHEMLKPSGDAGARRITYRYMLEGTALLAPVFAAVLLAPDLIMRTVYGRLSGYAEHDILLRVMVLGGCGLYLSHVLYCYLLGKKRVTAVAKCQLIASSAVVLCAFILIPIWGLTGAVISFIAMGTVRSWALIVAMRRDSRRTSAVNSYAVSMEEAS